ncbi:iron-containing redox enzyme family protein [Herminiimonas contaminans]|uniref:Iron-containing redox enzyme family protein n=1 Tax=Herminiimonas contaminans TaxID=1111140 RepID=A0ABS0ES33_9BURK|nr:iron-containing redox enzyme family protein [Herminiimonas contaminans]MBF8177655.1 iron-containing redox enzyme family protein [Herminiimonas contaminans]
MFSNTVIAAIESVKKESKALDFANRDVVLANLVFAHQVITASEDLLKEAVNASDGDLKEYFVAHLDEEKNHQVWLADDLATAGINVADMPLIRKAAEMAGSQYYMIKHVSPLALLGYMAVLEGFPTSLESVAKLEELHGVGLIRTLRYHAEHDLEHRKDLFSIIDKYPDDLILQNAIQTALYMNEFTSELNQE